MYKCRIAGLDVLINARYDRLKTQLEKYICGETDFLPQITIDKTDKDLMAEKGADLDWSLEDCEMFFSGNEFYKELLKHNGLMLHSSAIEYGGGAFLFSADPGTGKSTHTSLWRKYLGKRVRIINDDKPALRTDGNAVMVYGTPWSGTADLNSNISVPLKAIVFLERAETDFILRISSQEAFPLLFSQTIRQLDRSGMDSLLTSSDIILSNIPVYRMGCTISENAVKTAFMELVEGPAEKIKQGE